jgi:hypothetical protein
VKTEPVVDQQGSSPQSVTRPGVEVETHGGASGYLIKQK